MRNLCLLSSLLTLSLAGACTGGSGDGSGGGGGGTGADGGTRDGDAGTPTGDGGGGGGDCAAVEDFGDLGVLDGQVVGNGGGYLSVDAPLGEDDLFLIELYDGFAPFEKGLRTGTFELTTAQTDYNTCGACVGIFANNDPEAGPEMVYTAQSGTLEITSVEGNFAGRFTPSGGTTTFVGYEPSGDELIRNESCTVTGGGSSWDQPIPDAKQPPSP